MMVNNDGSFPKCFSLRPFVSPPRGPGSLWPPDSHSEVLARCRVHDSTVAPKETGENDVKMMIFPGEMVISWRFNREQWGNSMGFR